MLGKKIITALIVSSYLLGSLYIRTEEIDIKPAVTELKTKDQFESFINNKDMISVVKFYATWCPYSRENQKHYHALAHEYAQKTVGIIQFGEVDVDKLVDVRKANGVIRTPDFLMFKAGVAIEKTTSFNRLKDTITKLTAPEAKRAAEKSSLLSRLTDILLEPFRICKSLFA